MDVLWDLKEATVTEAMDELNQRRAKPVARGTVQVQLRRLETKGWLNEGSRGSKLTYLPACERTEARADIASDITRRVFDGSCADLVRCLYQQDKLSDDDIGRLEDLIGEMKKSK